MSRKLSAAIILLVGCLVLLSACDQMDALDGGGMGTECEEGERCLEPSDTPTATPEDEAEETATPTPEEEPECTPTPTPTPTDTPTPKPPTPTVAVVQDWSVIYHDAKSFCMDWGRYDQGVTPWMDVLVKLADTWYGPDRYQGDSVEPLPLPEWYNWVCSGSFGCLSNGEAWLAAGGQKSPPVCTEKEYTGKAKLYGPDGRFVIELSLRVIVESP